MTKLVVSIQIDKNMHSINATYFYIAFKISHPKYNYF